MEPGQQHIKVVTTGEAFEFSREERERHLYIVGKSGSGKSTLLFHLAMADIMAGEGVAIIDPHGDLAESIADAIPPARTHEVCYLDVADTDQPVGFNPLTRIAPGRQALAASGVVSAFKHLWGDSWGPRLEHFLFHGVAALIAQGDTTLMDLPRLYTDDDFRTRVLRRVTDPVTRAFWTEEYPGYDQRFRAEAAAPILNKAGQFAASPNLRLILGQRRPRYDLAFAMAHQRVLIANLAKGKVGEQAANLLGSLLISHLQLIAMERSHIAPHERVPFFVHVDEFQSFGTDTFAALLAEARKFACHFSLANQFTAQLNPMVRAAVLGNAGTLVVFRVGSTDAEILGPEFYPLPSWHLADQDPFRAWLRPTGYRHCEIIIPPPMAEQWGRLETIRAQSRRNFGRDLGLALGQGRN